MMMNYVSQTDNQDLMSQALLSLKGNWAMAFVAALIYSMITMVLQSIPGVGFFIALFVVGAMNLGWSTFVLAIAREKEPQFVQLFTGFQRFWLAFRAHILFWLFVSLWSILLVIPGIIAAISYSQTFFILADDEDCGALEAIDRSKEMMLGNKGKYFNLLLRFIGWILICILTFGVGFLLLFPYMSVSFAHFYEDVAFGPTLPGEEEASGPTPSKDDPTDSSEITDKIIERVMAVDRSIKDKERLKLEIESTISALEKTVSLSKEEIERIAAEVLEEEKSKT